MASAILALTLAGCERSASAPTTEARPAEPPLTAASAIAHLSAARSKADFPTASEIVNRAKSLEGTERKDFTDELLRLWALPSPADSDAEGVRIRLEIADYLLQQTKNQRIFGEVTPYLAYARRVEASGSRQNVWKALLVLGFGEESADIATLRKHLNDEDQRTANSAALGLAINCGVPEDDAPLIRQSIVRDSQRTYFDEAWRKAAGMRQFCRR